MHSPEHASEVQEARRVGGQRRRREATVVGAYDLDGLAGVELAERILHVATVDTLSQENSHQRTGMLVRIALALLKAHEVAELQGQIDDLRGVLQARRAGRR
jgi:hypothetical protein